MLGCPRCGATYRGAVARCPFDGETLAPAPDPLVGTTLGRYRIEAELGRGAFSTVYRARDGAGAVAIKVLAPELSRSETIRERFAREARAVARLSHPGIVRVLEVLEGPPAALVMRLLGAGPPGAPAGETLRARLDRDGRLPPSDARELAAALARALAAAHAGGVIHRDLKPSNVLLEASGPVLIDFGLARVQGEAGLTETGDLVGSPAYMAPEQVRGEAPTPEVDAYALGCLWFEALSGAPPFTGPAAAVLDAHLEQEPRTLEPAVLASDAALVRGLLAKAPADRRGAFEALVRAPQGGAKPST